MVAGLAYFATFSTPHHMKNINDFLKDQVSSGRTPSLQYVFFDTEEAIFRAAHGWRNVQGRTPADFRTMVHLYSITKTLTAVAVLQLAQRGSIDLDKPVATYLPDFPYPPAVTVKELLQHTAGIPNPLPLRWVHLEEEHFTFKSGSFFDHVFRANPTLDFAPGTRFRYSNLGYVLLGQLIERVSGQPYQDYIQQHIISPVGANNNLSFSLETSRHATGYQKRWSWLNALLGWMIDKQRLMGPHEGGWKPFRPFYVNGVAYGGLMGNAEGLMRYAQALLRPGDDTLLNASYKRLHFEEGQIQGKPTGMSYAWFVGSLKGNRYLAHAGGGGGYYTELRLYPDLGVGSLLLCNRTGIRDERLLDKIDKYFVTDSTSLHHFPKGSMHNNEQPE